MHNFSADHRFLHACKNYGSILEILKDKSSIFESNSSKKSFLCSFEECQNYEFVRFDCSFCHRNYCSQYLLICNSICRYPLFRHRQSEEHKCEILEAQKNVLMPPPKFEIRLPDNLNMTLIKICRAKPVINFVLS